MKTLGKFEIQGRLGQGAMGVVYKARDPLIGRLVALKTITTGLAEDPALLERFYQEARSAGALQHPNIVTIYELGEADNTPFIAMEYLNGSSLDKLIEGCPKLPLSQKVGYIVYVCRALEYSHKAGVVHRDIKPGNVMVTTDGVVKVVDFGIARIAENSKSQSGLIIGTLGYMSPQQIEGGRADARADIWATGAMFYELLAYHRPFAGENYGQLMLNIMTQKMPPLSESAPDTPEDVAAIVSRMLRKEIDQRYQSMGDALSELEPVWRRLQQEEVADLLTAARQMLKVGEVVNAYEATRKALQIDASNTQTKNLLEQINTEMRAKRIVPPMEGNPQGDETIIGPVTGSIRTPVSAIPALIASRGQNAAAQSDHVAVPAIRVPVAEPKQPVAVQSGAPSSTPAPVAVPKWKQPVPIALLVLAALIIAGGGTYLGLRRPGTSTSEQPVSTNAPAASTVPNSDAANVPASANAPASVPVPASGNVTPADLAKQPRPNVSSPVQPTGRAQDSARNNLNTNTSTGGTPAPQTQAPITTGGTSGQAATPPITVAANTPVSAPAAISSQPVAQPSQPATVNPQPVAQPSQPAAAAPAPAAKASEPAPASPAAAAVVSSSDNLDQQQIKVLLQQLTAAFSHRNISEVEELWPKPNKNTVNNLKQTFSAAKVMTREFHPQSVNVSPDGNTATAVGTYDGAVTIGGNSTPSSGNFYVRFLKKNGRWYIDDASF